MAQYCRYCSFMVCGDFNYCSKKDLCLSDKAICATNKCKAFDLNPIDALGINTEGYKPREKKQDEQAMQQIEFWRR